MNSENPRSLLRLTGISLGASVLLLLSMKLAIHGDWTMQGVVYLENQPPRDLHSHVAVQQMWVILVFLDSLPLIGGLWLSAAGFGSFLTRRNVLRPIVGMAALLQANWLLAWAGGLNRFTAWGLILLGIVLLIVRIASQSKQPRQWGSTSPTVGSLACVPVLGLLLVACVCWPGGIWKVEAWGYDVMSYHLQLPKEWLAAGRMFGLHHNVYSYLPSLVEVGYMLIGAAQGTMYEGIYAAQLFHASAAVYAAVLIGVLAARWTNIAGGVAAAGLFLATPWTVITGSLAYNEMFAMAFGAAALVAVFEERPRSLLIGAMLGASLLCKLTIGGMIAVPIGLIVLIQSRPKRAVLTAVAATAMLVPYLARNTIDTGNPIFPFATSELGRGHWTPELADRWSRAHHVDADLAQRIKALGEQWLCNTGYGAVLGGERRRESAEAESRNIARFDTQWGVPLLWLAALFGGVAAMRGRSLRRFATMMAMMIAIQLLLWMFATHLQSRFLIATLLPGCVLAGVGVGLWQRGGAVIAAALILALTVSSFNELFRQTLRINAQPLPMHSIVYALPSLAILQKQRGFQQMMVGDHLINRLPPDSHTLLVADNARLLFIRNRTTYNSAFDANPLGELVRAHGPDPVAINRALRDAGYTHVLVHRSELRRLHATYGFDPDVTEERFSSLIRAGWRKVWEHDSHVAAMFELPVNM